MNFSEAQEPPYAASPENGGASPEEIPETEQAAVPEPEIEAAPGGAHSAQPVQESFSAEELLPDDPAVAAITMEDAKLKAVLEAIVYVTDEPLSSTRSAPPSSSRATA